MENQISTINPDGNEDLVKLTLLHVTWREEAEGPTYHQFFYVSDEEDANGHVTRWRKQQCLSENVIQSRELCPEGWPPDASGANEDHRHKGIVFRKKNQHPIV
jgi:hypothetical protein